MVVCKEMTFHFLGTSSSVMVPSLECLWSSQVLPAWKTSEVGLVILHFDEGVTKMTLELSGIFDVCRVKIGFGLFFTSVMQPFL